ncbi:hypothetical protein DV737_g1511, partial [Chaetothyriales sp. CBS 132003]
MSIQPEAKDAGKVSVDNRQKEGDEKGDLNYYATTESVEEDKFSPLSGIEPYDGRRIITVRAVLTGMVLGNIISCANIYLGLKAGFGADATLFSAIFGFIICKGLERSKIPLLAGKFGPHENNIIQATAIGCIGIGFMFVSGVPALYQLELLKNPTKDLGTLICLSLVAGFWGLGFAVPFRSLFILRMLLDLNTGISFVLGSVIAWGVLGPIAVSTGVAAGIPGYLPDFPDLVTYNAFVPDLFVTMPSPSVELWSFHCTVVHADFFIRSVSAGYHSQQILPFIPQKQRASSQSAELSLIRFAKWVPNMSILGLAMTITGTSVVLSVLIGSIAAACWKRYHLSSHERFLYAVAAGAIAGEGVGFVVQAALQVAGVGGPLSNIGCVGDAC